MEEPLHLPVSGLVSRPPCQLHLPPSFPYCMDVPAWPWSHKESSQRRPRIACSTEVKLITPAWPLASRQTRNYGRHGAPWIQLPHYGIRRTKSPSSIARTRPKNQSYVSSAQSCRPKCLSFFCLKKIANKTFVAPFIFFFTLTSRGDSLIKVDYESIEDDRRELVLFFRALNFEF